MGVAGYGQRSTETSSAVAGRWGLPVAERFCGRWRSLRWESPRSLPPWIDDLDQTATAVRYLSRRPPAEGGRAVRRARELGVAGYDQRSTEASSVVAGDGWFSMYCWTKRIEFEVVT